MSVAAPQVHVDVRDRARGLMAATLHTVDGVGTEIAVEVYGDLRGMIDAAEAVRLAAEITSDGDTRAASRKAGRKGRVSKREADRRARAAKAVKANSELGDKLADGDMSAEQLDTIAEAMATDESAAIDQDLIDKVAAAPVDQGRKIGRDWAAARADRDEKQSEHDRQRKARRASMWFDTRKGLPAFKLEGDDATINELWQLIKAEERRLYNADGGRDVAPGKHRRTRDQRMFDAALRVLRGDASTGNGAAGGAAGGTGSGVANSAGRPAVVINIDLDNIADPGACPEMIGHGPVADSVVIDLLARAGLHINLRDLSGATMWWGRIKRHATLDQYIALVIRDKGCVLCGAPWQQCQAHHLTPWNAPAKGETNLDDMALLCASCHHQLHDTTQTLVKDLAGNWTTRPATTNETPPRSRQPSSPPHRRPSKHATPAGKASAAGSRRAAPGKRSPNDDGRADHHRHRTTPRAEKNDPDDAAI